MEQQVGDASFTRYTSGIIRSFIFPLSAKCFPDMNAGHCHHVLFPFPFNCSPYLIDSRIKRVNDSLPSPSIPTRRSLHSPPFVSLHSLSLSPERFTKHCSTYHSNYYDFIYINLFIVNTLFKSNNSLMW